MESGLSAVCGNAGDGLSKHQSVDLLRALVRQHRLEVRHVPDLRVLQRDAVRPQHRPGRARHVQRRPYVGQLAERHLLRRDLSGLLEPSAVQRDQTRLPQGDLHPGERLLGELEPRDRLAELLTRDRVRDRRLVTRPPGAQRAPDDPVPRLGQAAQRPAQPPGLRQHRRRRHPYVLQGQLRGHRGAQRQLLVDVPCREPTCAALHEEAADPVVRTRPDDRDVGHRAVRDPHLGAVQHPVRALALGVRTHVRRVRAVGGLGQAEAAERLAGGHPRQPFLLLLLRAVLVDRRHRERTLYGHEAAQPRVGRLQLTAGDAVRDRAGAGAAVPRQVHAQEAQFAQLGCQLARGERARLEPVGHVRLDPLGGVPAGRVADQPLLVGELVVDAQQLHPRPPWGFGPQRTLGAMAPRDLVRLLVDKGVLTDQRVAEAMATVPRELFVPQNRRDEAYTDTVLVTKWDDAGVAISSASQPAMVAIMLEQLQVAPGHSVLEIGAGSGYNAALRGRLAARVVTVDIDEDIARQARDRLTDVENVEVRVGDGWAGAPDHAPYDRIELAIGTSAVSAAWRDQLADASDAAPLCELLSRPPREERAPFIDPAVFARMALDEPRTLAVSDLSGALRPGLYDAGGAVVIDNERMLTYGSPAARDRLIYGLGTARPLDRSRLRGTASFGTPPPPPQGWRFVRRSCVVDVAEG